MGRPRKVFRVIAATLVLLAVGWCAVLVSVYDWASERRSVSGVMDIAIEGPYSRQARSQAEGGYSSQWAGGGFSFGIPSPRFTLYADSLPRLGSHPVGPPTSAARAEVWAGLTGGHRIHTMWTSDSGIVEMTHRDPRTLAFTGTFDIWLTCLQDCPCQSRPCVVRARGSFSSSGERD